MWKEIMITTIAVIVRRRTKEKMTVNLMELKQCK
jgi:hypothetical protein